MGSVCTPQIGSCCKEFLKYLPTIAIITSNKLQIELENNLALKRCAIMDGNL